MCYFNLYQNQRLFFITIIILSIIVIFLITIICFSFWKMFWKTLWASIFLSLRPSIYRYFSPSELLFLWLISLLSLTHWTYSPQCNSGKNIMLGKCNIFHFIVSITLVLLIWKMDGSLLDEKLYLRLIV